MGDIDPRAQVQRYTPRQTDIVDAVVETKRVMTASLRANPLRNAVVDDGLMKWRGNYGSAFSLGDIRASYLWIGEVSPRDAVLNKTQRGVFITRDDPSHARVLWMYDPWAASAGPDRPLRQLFTMNDADDRPVLHEHIDGGLAIPISPIPLMERGWTYVNGSAVPAWAGATASATFQNLYEGTGPMTGVRIRVIGIITSVAGTNLIARAHFSFNNGYERYSDEAIVTGAQSEFFVFEEDFKGLDLVGRIVQVSVQARISNGGTGNTVCQPLQCYSYS